MGPCGRQRAPQKFASCYLQGSGVRDDSYCLLSVFLFLANMFFCRALISSVLRETTVPWWIPMGVLVLHFCRVRIFCRKLVLLLYSKTKSRRAGRCHLWLTQGPCSPSQENAWWDHLSTTQTLVLGTGEQTHTPDVSRSPQTCAFGGHGHVYRLQSSWDIWQET